MTRYIYFEKLIAYVQNTLGAPASILTIKIILNEKKIKGMLLLVEELHVILFNIISTQPSEYYIF